MTAGYSSRRRRQRTGEWQMTDTDPAVVGYRSTDACKLAGITYRQLDYWHRTDLAWSSVRDAAGSGTSRRWSREDIAYLRLIRELLDVGVDLGRIREISRPLRQSIDDRAARPFFVLTPTKGTAVAGDDLVAAVLASVSVVVLNLDDACALDPERDTTPGASGAVSTTSTGVSSGAATAGL